MVRIVAKFGGTSVKTAPAIRKVAEIIRDNQNIKAVVVSAVGGVTNLLIDFCRASDDLKSVLIEQIIKIHLELMDELNLNLRAEITEKIKRLEQVERIDNQTIDLVVSLGEDLSSLIVNAYLNQHGIESQLLDARSFLITDNLFGKAVPNIAKIKEFEFPDGLFVTQGFIGASEDGETTTLGRGGSDYSAALVAEAMKVDELLIYTDVPGVYTSDPNKIDNVSLIPELTFQEMAEMANFGAKILHPATLEPCVRANIPIRILSTFDAGKPGTLITIDDNEFIKTAYIRAVTMRSNQVLVTIKSLKMLNAYGFLANIFKILSSYKISIDLITTSEVSVALTIDGTSLGSHSINPFVENKQLLAELNQFAEIVIEEELALLAVVGHGLTIPGIVQKILKVIESYKVRLVCYGASNSSIGILVPKDVAQDVANILHRNLLIDNYKE